LPVGGMLTMLRCREIFQLVSESMERRLPLRQRMELQMQLMLCRMCAGFARHVRLLGRAAKRDSGSVISAASRRPGLSAEARERMKVLMGDDRPEASVSRNFRGKTAASTSSTRRFLVVA